jgi:putative sterol carrier protein
VRRKLPPPAASQVYQLTPAGLALEPVLNALGRWGGANATPPAEHLTMSLDAHMVSLRTLFDPERAAGFEATLQLEVEDQPFRAIVAGGAIDVDRGDAAAPDATLTTDAATLLALIHGRTTVPDALASGDARIEGDGEAVERFVGLFPLPAAAA